MATATKNRKRYKLSAVVQEIEGKHPTIEIETDDGQVFEIPPPQLWPDAVMAVQDDPVESSKALLGAQYPAFVKAGGSAALLLQVIAQSQGVDLGESSAS